MGPNSCPTVTIKTEPSTDNPAGIVVINESDFDAETMELYVAPEVAPEVPVENKEVEVTKGKAAKAVAPWAA